MTKEIAAKLSNLRCWLEGFDRAWEHEYRTTSPGRHHLHAD